MPRQRLSAADREWALKRRAAVVLTMLMMLTASCADDAPGTTSAPTAMGEPWTTVPSPTVVREIPLAEIDGATVCVEVDLGGVFDPGTTVEKVDAVLGILGLDTGAPCEATITVEGTAERLCAFYSGNFSCCNGWHATGEISLSVDGETIRTAPFDQTKPTPNQCCSGECYTEDEPLDISSIVQLGGIVADRPNPIEVAMTEWFEVPLFMPGSASHICPLTDQSFWLLVQALHHDDPEVVRLAAEHLGDCAREWRKQGEPADVVPYGDAVPHLLSVPGQIDEVETALRAVTGEDFRENPDPKSDWWLWWENHKP